MKKVAFLTTVMTAGLVTALSAATPEDSNGDGVLTFDEVQAAMPEITVEAFNQMDTNLDGASPFGNLCIGIERSELVVDEHQSENRGVLVDDGVHGAHVDG